MLKRYELKIQTLAIIADRLAQEKAVEMPGEAASRVMANRPDKAYYQTLDTK